MWTCWFFAATSHVSHEDVSDEVRWRYDLAFAGHAAKTWSAKTCSVHNLTTKFYDLAEIRQLKFCAHLHHSPIRTRAISLDELPLPEWLTSPHRWTPQGDTWPQGPRPIGRSLHTVHAPGYGARWQGLGQIIYWFQFLSFHGKQHCFCTSLCAELNVLFANRSLYIYIIYDYNCLAVIYEVVCLLWICSV